MANVLEVTVGVGATVHKGDVLIRLDGRDLAARLREAEAGVAAARADARAAPKPTTSASSAPDRARRGDPKGIRGRQDARYAMAQSRSQAAEQAVAQARVALGYVEIAAPIDGGGGREDGRPG